MKRQIKQRVNALVDTKQADKLLREVINYHEGKGKYNFSEFAMDDRNIAAFDAWEKIYYDITVYLAGAKTKKAK